MKFDIEVFTNCYHDFGFVSALWGIESLGVHDIELGINAIPGVLDLPHRMEELDRWDPTQVDRMKVLLKKYNLNPATGFIFVENTNKEEFILDKLKFDVAAELGVEIVNLSVTWNKPIEEAYKIFPDVLEYCSQYNFQLALELHPPLFDNAEVFWRVANDFPGFPLKANFDTANVYFYNENIDGPSELDKVMERLAHMHLKDSYCLYQDFTFPALGEGKVPFRQYFEICQKGGFHGPASLEVEGGDKEQKTFAGKHQVMLRSIEFLKKNGWM